MISYNHSAYVLLMYFKNSTIFYFAYFCSWTFKSIVVLAQMNIIILTGLYTTKIIVSKEITLLKNWYLNALPKHNAQKYWKYFLWWVAIHMHFDSSEEELRDIWCNHVTFQGKTTHLTLNSQERYLFVVRSKELTEFDFAEYIFLFNLIFCILHKKN